MTMHRLPLPCRSGNPLLYFLNSHLLSDSEKRLEFRPSEHIMLFFICSFFEFMTVTIKPLTECSRHIDELTQALHTEWHDFAPWSNMEKILNRYRNALACESVLPKVWMAEDAEGRLLGSASLKEYDLKHHEAERYWLGDVFVLPEHRGCGAGGALVDTCIAAARELSIDKLYLYTPDMQALYARYGWQETDKREVNGETVSVMVLALR